MNDDKLSSNEYVEHVCGRASKRICFLVLLTKGGRPLSDIVMLGNTQISS